MSKRSKGKVKVAPVQTKVEIRLSPLQELLKSLFVVSEARLVSKEKRLSAEAVSKVIASLENVVTTIIKESRKEEWQKYAIRLVMAIQLSSGLQSALSKKIVSIFFTFLLSELKRNWRDYGFKEEDVHEDYKQEDDDFEGKMFEVHDITKEEYASWERAFVYTTS